MATLATIECRTPSCNGILLQRRPGWQGDPVWIKCRKCRQYMRVAPEGVKRVEAPGDD